MKRMIVSLTALAALICVLCCGCALGQLFEPYSLFPSGYTDKDEHFDPEGFQDYTDYCKYFYDSAEPFERDGRFKPVADVGVETAAGYFEHFKDCMESEERLDEYDFDPGIISPDDLVQIISDPHFTPYDDYDVFLFDVQSKTLYYIHQNI